jgi:predicted AAA+ superfamily ATPase
LRGALFENMLIAETLKQRTHLGMLDNLYFYRDQSGNEVDLLLDHGHYLEAVEIKSSQTIVHDFFKGLNMIQSLLPQVTKTCLIYGGQETRIQFGHRVCPWFEFV